MRHDESERGAQLTRRLVDKDGPKVPGKRAPNKKPTMDEYAKMKAVYFETQSTTKVAAAVGVDFKVARRYIFDGDPKRGMAAIHDMWLEAQKKATAAEVEDLATFQKNKFKESKVLIKALEVEIQKWFSEIKRTIVNHNRRVQEARAAGKPEDEVIMAMLTKLGEVTAAYDKAVSMGERLLGRADVVTQHQFEGWSQDELRAYCEKGIWPDRLRNMNAN
jgi:hypothetical protein